MNALPVIIFGTNLVAELVADILTAQDIVIYGFLSENKNEQRKEIDDIPIMGTMEDKTYFSTIETCKTEYCIAAQDPHQRKSMLAKLFHEVKRLPMNVLHPLASISPSASIATGNVIGAQCIISAKVKVESLNIIGAGTLIDFGAHIGQCTTIEMGVIIGKHARIGDEVYIGAGAIIQNDVEVGKGALIAPGAIVSKKVEPGEIIKAYLSEKVNTTK